MSIQRIIPKLVQGVTQNGFAESKTLLKQLPQIGFNKSLFKQDTFNEIDLFSNNEFKIHMIYWGDTYQSRTLYKHALTPSYGKTLKGSLFDEIYKDYLIDSNVYEKDTIFDTTYDSDMYKLINNLPDTVSIHITQHPDIKVI